MKTYIECDIYDLPEGVRFDTPRANQGQIITTSYGTFGLAEADHGDPYMSIYDASDHTTTYYRRSDVAPATLDVREARIAKERQQADQQAKISKLAKALPRLAAAGISGIRQDGDEVVVSVRGEEKRCPLTQVRRAAAAESNDIHTYGIIADRTYTDILTVVECQ